MRKKNISMALCICLDLLHNPLFRLGTEFRLIVYQKPILVEDFRSLICKLCKENCLNHNACLSYDLVGFYLTKRDLILLHIGKKTIPSLYSWLSIMLTMYSFRYASILFSSPSYCVGISDTLKPPNSSKNFNDVFIKTLEDPISVNLLFHHVVNKLLKISIHLLFPIID